MNRFRARKAVTLMALATLLTASCGGSSEEEGSGGGAEPSSDGARDPGKPSPIDGVYFNGDSVLTLGSGRWALINALLQLEGSVAVSEDELVLSDDASCPESGTYGWALSADTITLSVVEESCPGRDITMEGTWGPITPLGEGATKGEQVLLPDLRFATYAGRADVSGAASSAIDVYVKTGPGGGWVFSPTVLVGSPGQDLELVVRNKVGPGTAPLLHNLSLDEQEIDVDVLAGEQVAVTVTFPDTGTVTFYCKYHLDNGQAGVLTVG